MKSNRQHGFTLLEMVITLSIGLIIGGITFVTMMPMLNRGHVEVAYDMTLALLRDTRHLAITQSHQYYVNFTAPGTIQVTYQPPPDPNTGALQPIQLVNSYTLPGDVSFAVTGFPANAPDGFGTGIVAIDFGQGIAAGGLQYVCFMPDGSSRDNLGNYNSGVIYIARTADLKPYNSRSITVWGATGRIRGWRLVQQGGGGVWVQQ